MIMRFVSFYNIFFYIKRKVIVTSHNGILFISNKIKSWDTILYKTKKVVERHLFAREVKCFLVFIVDTKFPLCSRT